MFLPKEKKFFDLYENLAKKISEAVLLLEKLKKNYLVLSQVYIDINKLEDDADDIVHQIVKNLHYDHTRVTEEKGDIRFFAHNMDNVIDSLEKAVNRLKIYRLKKLPPFFSDFLPVLKEAAGEIKKGVESLRNIRKNDQVLADCCIRINDLENEGDRINRNWSARIMNRGYENNGDFRQIIALKEILDLLEYAMDQCEDVANALEAFRLKGTA